MNLSTCKILWIYQYSVILVENILTVKRAKESKWYEGYIRTLLHRTIALILTSHCLCRFGDSILFLLNVGSAGIVRVELYFTIRLAIGFILFPFTIASISPTTDSRPSGWTSSTSHTPSSRTISSTLPPWTPWSIIVLIILGIVILTKEDFTIIKRFECAFSIVETRTG